MPLEDKVVQFIANTIQALRVDLTDEIGEIRKALKSDINDAIRDSEKRVAASLREEMQKAIQESEDRVVSTLRKNIKRDIQDSEERVIDHVEKVRDQLDRSMGVREENIRTDCVHADELSGIVKRVEAAEELLGLTEAD